MGGEVEQVAGFGNAFVEHDVELGGAEGRRDFVFDDAHAGAVADDFVADFDGLDAAHVEAHGGVELERVAAGGGLGVAEHDADLLAQLVGENDGGLGLVDGAAQFAERLAHEARLDAHGGIAHVAFDLGARHERRDRVDHHDVHAAGADEGLDDFEGLLAGVGLRDEQVVNVHTALGRVGGVEGVFHVNVGGGAAHFLGLGHDVLAEGGFAG